jgi:SAM-dependent methyltransferase
MNTYRCRLLELFCDLLRPATPVESALDFGCGDGWFAEAIRRHGITRQVTGVDVQLRQSCCIEPIQYDGRRLPFADAAFDLVSSIDVLHHCPHPVASLHEALRCARRWFLIKDHTYRSPAGKLALCILDEVGNRRFGVPSPYHYQRAREWFPSIEAAGFALRQLIHPAPCHRGLLGWATNRLQFIALWERVVTPSGSITG